MTYCKRLIFQNPSYRLTRSLPLRTTVVVASTQVVIWLLDCILNLSFPFSSLSTGTTGAQMNRAQSLKRSRGNQLCVGEHFQFAFAFPREKLVSCIAQKFFLPLLLLFQDARYNLSQSFDLVGRSEASCQRHKFFLGIKV